MLLFWDEPFLLDEWMFPLGIGCEPHFRCNHSQNDMCSHIQWKENICSSCSLWLPDPTAWFLSSVQKDRCPKLAARSDVLCILVGQELQAGISSAGDSCLMAVVSVLHWLANPRCCLWDAKRYLESIPMLHFFRAQYLPHSAEVLELIQYKVSFLPH